MEKGAANGEKRLGARLLEAARKRDEELIAAVRKRDEEEVERLVRAGVDANAKEEGAIGDTALQRACEQGSEAIARRLLEAGADKDARNGLGTTPLILAARSGSEACVRLLLEAGANWKRKGMTGATAEEIARTRGWKRCEELLKAWRVADEERLLLKGVSGKVRARKGRGL